MKRHRGTRGSALLIAVIVVVIVGGMSAAVLTLTYSHSRFTFSASESEESRNTAEAGLDDSINKLNALAAQTWKGSDSATKASFTVPTALGSYFISSDVTTTMDYYPANLGTVTSFAKDPITGVPVPVTQTTLTGSINGGTYTVTMTPAYNGVGQYLITAHGTRHKDTKGISVLVMPGAMNDIGDFGLVGKVTLTATSSNVFVDSYQSSKGTYASQATNLWKDGVTTYARDKGNIGSNGDISVNNGIIFGNATPGPTHTVSTGKSTITGTTTPAGADLTLPSITYTPPDKSPLTFPKGLVSIGSAGSGTPTVVHYSTAVTSGSGAGITINGPVVMYVDGDIGMNATEALTFADPSSSLTIYQGSGSITLNGQTYASGVTPKASNLTINSATTGDIKFNGGADVYANVYAPDAPFKQTGTSVFYGKMVASEISVGGNMTFHRDEDINAGATAPPVFFIKAYNETLY